MRNPSVTFRQVAVWAEGEVKPVLFSLWLPYSLENKRELRYPAPILKHK